MNTPKLSTALNQAVNGVSIGLMCVAFVITFLHVIGRYVLRAPIFYSEELARFCFIWTTFLGASIVHRNDEHTAVSYFVGKLPFKTRTVFYIIRSVIILLLLIGLAYYGFLQSIARSELRMPATGISWTYVYSSLAVGSVLMTFSTVKHIRNAVNSLRSR